MLNTLSHFLLLVFLGIASRRICSITFPGIRVRRISLEFPGSSLSFLKAELTFVLLQDSGTFKENRLSWQWYQPAPSAPLCASHQVPWISLSSVEVLPNLIILHRSKFSFFQTLVSLTWDSWKQLFPAKMEVKKKAPEQFRFSMSFVTMFPALFNGIPTFSLLFLSLLICLQKPFLLPFLFLLDSTLDEAWLSWLHLCGIRECLVQSSWPKPASTYCQMPLLNFCSNT